MDKSLSRLDRSAMVVNSLHEQSDEKGHWLSKTSSERLEALEQIRQIVYGYDPATTRLQRVLEIIESNTILNGLEVLSKIMEPPTPVQRPGSLK